MPNGNKKILMISGLFYPDVGGTENECRKISKKLKELGHDVAVLTQHRDGLSSFDTVDNIPVYRYIKGWHFFELSFMLSVFSFLVKNRKRFDCIFCFGLYLFTAPAAIFCRITGRKMFFRLESARQTGDFVRISKLKKGRFVLMCAKMSHAAIAITDEIKSELLENGFPKKKILKIPNSVDTDVFFPGKEKHDNPFVISYVGRLTAGKGLEIFIKALSILKGHTEQFKVLIVGSGEAKASLIEQVKQCGLQNFISFAGEIENVAPYYQQSHVFVLPSFSEGLPLSLLEAMACGTTVIASKVGGIVDAAGLMKNKGPEKSGYWIYENAILFTPGDSNALSEALLKLQNNIRLQKQLSQKALKTVKSHYCLTAVIKDYLKLLSV